LGALVAQFLHACPDRSKVVSSAGAGALAAQLLHTCPDHRKIIGGAGSGHISSVYHWERKPPAVGKLAGAGRDAGIAENRKSCPDFWIRVLHQKKPNLVSGMGLMGCLELKIVAATRQRPLMCAVMPPADRRFPRSAVRAYTLSTSMSRPD
jgi:hypothetical protein